MALVLSQLNYAQPRNAADQRTPRRTLDQRREGNRSQGERQEGRTPEARATLQLWRDVEAAGRGSATSLLIT